MDIKKLLLLLMVMGFTVGCSSIPEEDEGETANAPVACDGCDDSYMKTMGQVSSTGEAGSTGAAGTAGAASYVVERGDNLWNISGKESVYGNPYQWPLIYKANRAEIKDADLIYPGQDLSIVRGMSYDAINAAVSHAKSRGAWSLGEVEATDTAYLNE